MSIQTYTPSVRDFQQTTNPWQAEFDLLVRRNAAALDAAERALFATRIRRIISLTFGQQ